MVTNNEIFVFAIYYYNIIGLQFVFLVDSKIRIPRTDGLQTEVTCQTTGHRILHLA